MVRCEHVCLHFDKAAYLRLCRQILLLNALAMLTPAAESKAHFSRLRKLMCREKLHTNATKETQPTQGAAVMC